MAANDITPTLVTASTSLAYLDSLPDELLLHIMSFLDVPELHNLSRVNHHLRILSLDPVLHSARLSRASLSLSRSIPARPPLANLISNRIYITRTTQAARRLGRDLIKIKLNRSLLRRPTIPTLVSRNVLPTECLPSAHLAPSLIETKRRIEKEKIKDVLRNWIEERRQKAASKAETGVVEQDQVEVKRLIRRFGNGGKMEGGCAADYGKGGRLARWGMQARDRREREAREPTRAHVWGLRRFWEKKGREGVVG